MVERRGSVYIAPVASYLPSGRMVDPQASIFSVSWQDWDNETQAGELIEDGGEVAGAEAAIAWGRGRSDRVLIRLGHTDETHFSAGYLHLTEQTSREGRTFPTWPPEGPPPEGWWIPSDEAAAGAGAVAKASE
jgi:hypothetical protein